MPEPEQVILILGPDTGGYCVHDTAGNGFHVANYREFTCGELLTIQETKPMGGVKTVRVLGNNTQETE